MDDWIVNNSERRDNKMVSTYKSSPCSLDTKPDMHKRERQRRDWWAAFGNDEPFHVARSPPLAPSLFISGPTPSVWGMQGEAMLFVCRSCHTNSRPKKKNLHYLAETHTGSFTLLSPHKYNPPIFLCFSVSSASVNVSHSLLLTTVKRSKHTHTPLLSLHSLKGRREVGRGLCQ